MRLHSCPFSTLDRMSQDPKKPAKPPVKSASLDDMLPPVQAPSAGFLLQLFLIPMIIVTIIVLVFLGFHWLAQMSSDPSDLIAGLSTTNETGWQKAHALSDLLRDPTKDHLSRPNGVPTMSNGVPTRSRMDQDDVKGLSHKIKEAK